MDPNNDEEKIPEGTIQENPTEPLKEDNDKEDLKISMLNFHQEILQILKVFETAVATQGSKLELYLQTSKKEKDDENCLIDKKLEQFEEKITALEQGIDSTLSTVVGSGFEAVRSQLVELEKKLEEQNNSQQRLENRLLVVERNKAELQEKVLKTEPPPRMSLFNETLFTPLKNASTTRRQSNLFSEPLLIPKPATVSIMATEYRVEDSQKMGVPITARKILELKKTFNVYYATSMDKSKKLINFLKSDVIYAIVSHFKAKRSKTVASSLLSFESMFLLEDSEVLACLADVVRPLNAQNYEDLMFAAVTKLVPTSKSYTSYAVKGYSTAMHSVVDKLLQEFLDIDTLFREGASEEVTRNMPRHVWGSEYQPGTFRILLKCFGSNFEPVFKKLVKESEVKLLSTLEDFVEYMQNLNNRIAEASEENEKLELGVFPQNSGYSEKSEKSEYFHRDSGARDFSRNSRESGSKYGYSQNSQISRIGRGTTANLRRVEEEFEEGPDRNEVDSDNEDLGRGDNCYSPKDDEDESGSNEGDPPDQLNIMGQPGPRKDFQPTRILNRNSGAPLAARGTSTEVTKGPCFTMYRTGSCPNGSACNYSHDSRVLRAFANSEVEKAKQTPFYSPNSTDQPSSVQSSLYQKKVGKVE